MIQLSAGQLLQIAFTVGASAVAVIAGVFLLVLRATRRRRGLAWVWGWACLAVNFGLLALAQSAPALRDWLSAGAACAAIGCGIAGVIGAQSLRTRQPVPLWMYAVLTLAAGAALATQHDARLVGDLVASEIPLAVSVVLQAAILLPMARTARMSGLQTVCAVDIILAILFARTLITTAFLAAHGEALTTVYWTIEVTGGIILSFLLAMGELVALLDQVRVELEGSNASLNTALERLEVAAKLDPLTGLYNRYAFYTLVGQLASLGKMNGSIAIIDLNGLKRINDTFGHHAGDCALLGVATRLQEVVRESDFVFRWGGDEFVVLLLGMQPDAARERIAHFPPPAPLELPGQEPVPLSVSWGIAPLGPDVDSALRDADAQLYAQKRLLTRAAGKLTST